MVLAGSQKEVEPYYLKSKIFAFTSSSEGFPNVIGEAMSAGLPVVAFDCMSGPSDMIANEKNGFLIELFNYESFKKHLQILMSDESLRLKLGLNAAESIQDFKIDEISKKYKKMILE